MSEPSSFYSSSEIQALPRVEYQVYSERIRVTNRVWTRAVGWGRLGECQDFWAAFQAVGVNSATRLAGQSPNRGSTSLRY